MARSEVSLPTSSSFKATTHRLIASRFPTVGVFDDLAVNEDDLRAAFELEALTNDRLQGLSRLSKIPSGGLVSGPTATLVMAAFLHSDQRGGRFSDYRLGAWYAATEVATAIEETVYHHERRLRASSAGFPNRIQMRELVSYVDGVYLDIRGMESALPEIYSLTDYAASQAFVANLRWPFGAESGIVYDSVRRRGGINICIFEPADVGLPVVQGDHYEYVWDAVGQLDVLRLTAVERSST